MAPVVRVAVIIIMSFVALSLAIVCRPNYCQSVTCKPIDQDDCVQNGGIFHLKGGFCGCCPSCPRLLSKFWNGWLVRLVRLIWPCSVRCGRQLQIDQDERNATARRMRTRPQMWTLQYHLRWNMWRVVLLMLLMANKMECVQFDTIHWMRFIVLANKRWAGSLPD